MTTRVGAHLPTFLIIGAPRAGTTSLYQYLKQHPGVFMSPVKEPHYFAFDESKSGFEGPGDDVVRAGIAKNWDAYRSLFEGAQDMEAIGEASTTYMYSPWAAERIKNQLGEVRLIAVLRDPVQRAYSHYRRMVKKEREPLQSFADALRAENERIAAGWSWAWHYKQTGFYWEQLRRYFDLFPSRNIRVFLYEDLQEDPQGMLRDLFKFIGVDNTFEPRDLQVEYNTSGLPRSPLVNRVLETPNFAKAVAKRVLPHALRRRVKRAIHEANLADVPPDDRTVAALRRDYESDILKLEGLLGRDLSQWHGTTSRG